MSCTNIRHTEHISRFRKTEILSRTQIFRGVYLQRRSKKSKRIRNAYRIIAPITCRFK